MCCCGCSQCGALIANILYVTQRLATCFVLTALVGTLILTVLVMLAVGVGLGYHYCVVETKTYQLNLQEYQYPVHKDATTEPSGRRFAKFEQNSSLPRPENAHFFDNPKFVMPLNTNDADFSLLIAKIRGMHKNVTVHFVETPNRCAVWFAGVFLVGCMIFTLIMMLALGIGLGYNYCYVDYQTRARYRFVPPHYVTVKPQRRHGKDEISNALTNNLQNEGLEIFSTTQSPILKTNSEKLNTYFETLSTKMMFEKNKKKSESSMEVMIKPTPKILKYYKFWARPVNTTVEPAIAKNENEKAIEKLEVSTNGTNLVKKNDSVEKTKEIIGVDDSNSKDGKMISISGMDLMALLSQLRAENRNYSLQILTS